MSLPRPGGRQAGENKADGSGGSAYSSSVAFGGGTTAPAPSAFAGYTPPSSAPPANQYAGAGGGGGNHPAGPSGFSFSGPGGGGGGFGGAGVGDGYGGGAGAFGSTATPQGFGGGGPAGGALGGGGVGGDARNQYGFSNAGAGGGGGVGSTGMDSLGANIGAVASAAMGMGGGGAQQREVGAGGQQQQPLDWHQWTPDGVNAQMMQATGTVATNFLKSNMVQYQPRVSGYWNTLKVYFTVDNRYVLKKLKALLLAVLKKDWFRLPSEDEVKDDQGRPKFERPVADANAPDLYVPLMSFITFVLVTGYAKGSSGAGKFSPEDLTEVTSSCVILQLLEVLLIRLGLYLLNSPAVVLDLVAYTGYKYVGLCINMTLGICLGKTAYYVALLWTGSMASFFMFKTMAHTVPTGSASREIMILGFAALQLLSMWWLGQPDDLVGQSDDLGA
eukprot:g11295.t1